MVRVRTAMKNFSSCNKHFGTADKTSRARRLTDVAKNADKSKCGPGGCQAGGCKAGGCGPGGCTPGGKGGKC